MHEWFIFANIWDISEYMFSALMHMDLLLMRKYWYLTIVVISTIIRDWQTVEHNRPTPRSIDVSDAENLDTLQRPGAMTRGENSISALITKQPTALKVATILFWTVTKTDQLFVRCNLHFSSQSTRVGKRDELLRSDISRLLSSHIFSWMQLNV